MPLQNLGAYRLSNSLNRIVLVAELACVSDLWRWPLSWLSNPTRSCRVVKAAGVDLEAPAGRCVEAGSRLRQRKGRSPAAAITSLTSGTKVPQPLPCQPLGNHLSNPLSHGCVFLTSPSPLLVYCRFQCSDNTIFAFLQLWGGSSPTW